MQRTGQGEGMGGKEKDKERKKNVVRWNRMKTCVNKKQTKPNITHSIRIPKSVRDTSSIFWRYLSARFLF